MHLLSEFSRQISTQIAVAVMQARGMQHAHSIDSTFDASQKEQVAFVIRYVHNKTSIISEQLKKTILS